jgi:hypothetical protein
MADEALTPAPRYARGLIPCVAGIHLVTLGYLRLFKQTKPAMG